ncbi:MAG: stage III sporulation protein AG [Lachnospiraceae bacterium]|nr:stage III sporulation protein AG [Lachnospiraceae bacterium]
MNESIKKILPVGKLKKDHFLIMILSGILFLVIMWPTEKKPQDSGESVLWDSYSGIMNQATEKDDFYEAADDEMMIFDELNAYAEYLEAKLEETLKEMEGAGQTKVMITLKSSAETIVEKDAPMKRAGSTEVDSAGGSRNTSDIETGQETVFYTNASGRQVPFARKTIRPVIEGVLVVTQGGGNEKIIRNITDAIKALFGVDEHKIKIVKMIS